MNRATVLGGVFVALLLSGCAGEAADSVSLADAKAIVQLTRIEVEERLRATAPVTVDIVHEGSAGCEEDDPEGRERRWEVEARFDLHTSTDEDLPTTVQALVDSFSANGWSEVEYGGAGSVTLSRPNSDASIALVASKAGQVGAAPGISASITSDCVATGGVDSDEVTRLEELAQ